MTEKSLLEQTFSDRLFDQTEVYLINTTATPHETQDEIRKVLGVK